MAHSHSPGTLLDVAGVEHPTPAALAGRIPVADGEPDDDAVEQAHHHLSGRVVQQCGDRFTPAFTPPHLTFDGLDQSGTAPLPTERDHQFGGELGDAMTVLGNGRPDRFALPGLC